MDIGRSIQYIFHDPNWIKKVVIGGLLLIIPIIGWMIVGGYFIRTVQTVSRGTDTPLPEWDQFGDDLVRGLKWFVILIVWLIPVWVLSFCAAIFGVIDEGAASMLGLMLNCVVFIYSIAFYFLYPVIIGRFAQTEQIGDGFQFGPIIQDAQKIPSQLLIFVVMYFVVSIVAGFGLILCFIGVFFTLFIANLIWAHLIAQISNMLGYPQVPGREPESPPAV